MAEDFSVISTHTFGNGRRYLSLTFEITVLCTLISDNGGSNNCPLQWYAHLTYLEFSPSKEVTHGQT
jgi:hypothetical protein